MRVQPAWELRGSEAVLTRKNGLLALLIALGVFAVCSPALRNGFVGYDDPDYVTANEHVNTGLTLATVSWAFGSAHAGNWHPLTWLSHALDSSFFGLNPAGHHFTSLLLHAANSALLFLWLTGATGRTGPSAFVAAIFGVHPLHVESVAWVAERKDVLSAFFGILALIAWSGYIHKRSVSRYCLTAACLAASLMAKQMLVTLPILLLFLDYWPLRRKEPVSRLIREKLPLLSISVIACAAAIWAQQQSGALVSEASLPLGLRLSNAAVSYIRYLGKLLWPANLAVFYPYPVAGIPPWIVVLAVALITAISWLAWAARTKHPYVTVGWFWYLLTLLPVIGMIQVGMQAMADRYMYLPMVGLLIAAAWSLRPAPLAAAAAAAALLACVVLTSNQLHYWKDSLTLFSHAIDVTTDNYVAHDNLGVELDRLGRPEEALAQYRETIRIRPGDRHGEYNLSQAIFAKAERTEQSGQLDAAIDLFREGLAHAPGNATAYLSLGVALARAGRPAEARTALENAVRCDPASVEARYDLGVTQAALGDPSAALQSFDAALRLKPDYAPAQAARTRLCSEGPAACFAQR